MAQHGLADLVLIVMSGTAVGLTVWLCGRGPRSRWLVAAWATAGMLVLHFLIMSVVPSVFDSGPVDVFTVLWTWPWLSIATFLPLAAALTSYWMSVVKLVLLAQTVIAGTRVCTSP